MSEYKKVNVVKTDGQEIWDNPHVTSWRVEAYAPGLDWFVVAGFSTKKEAKAYKRFLQGKGDAPWEGIL